MDQLEFEAHFQDRTMAYHGSPYATIHNWVSNDRIRPSFFNDQVTSKDGRSLTTSTSTLKPILLPNDQAQQESQKAIPMLLRFVLREEMLGALDMGS